MSKTVIIIIIAIIATVLNIAAIIYTVNIYTKLTSLIEIKDRYITFQNEEEEKIGQIWAGKSVLMMYGYNQRSVEIGAGNDVIINAGGGSVEIRQGNDTKIKISEDRIDINTDNLYINNKKYNN